MKFGVIVLPGSNCDHDAYNVVAEVAKQPCSMIWHESRTWKTVSTSSSPADLPMVTTCAPAPSRRLLRR